MRRLVFFISVVMGGWMVMASVTLAQQGTITIDALVPGCGDGLIMSGETCDGINLGGASCPILGYGGGVLSCTAACVLATTSCTALVTTAPAEGGGGSGARHSGPPAVDEPAPVPAVLSLAGWGPASTDIRLLQNGTLRQTVRSDAAGYFSLVVTLPSGYYRFSLQSAPMDQPPSAIVTIPVVLRDGLVTKIDDIIIPPTVVAMAEGAVVVLRGTAPPRSVVMIEGFTGTDRLVGTTTADEQGNYTITFTATDIDIDTIEWQVRTMYEGVIGESGKVSTASPDNSSPTQPTSRCAEQGDRNGDCFVNTLDLMIQLQVPVSIDPVSLRPFSIMAYYWTG